MNFVAAIALFATAILANEIVIVDETVTTTVAVTTTLNTMASKTVTATGVVVVEETAKVFYPDPNGARPYKNGLTLDIFVSCNNRKGFIAKRGNGIYTENYEIPPGQHKPIIYKK